MSIVLYNLVYHYIHTIIVQGGFCKTYRARVTSFPCNSMGSIINDVKIIYAYILFRLYFSEKYLIPIHSHSIRISTTEWEALRPRFKGISGLKLKFNLR